MPTIIRDRSAVKGAAMEDLNATYRALKNEPGFKGFNTRAAAEVQVQMAIMAAENAAGHAGVPKGITPKALTPQEIKTNNPYKEGTLSHELHNAVKAQQPIEPRPKASEDKERAPRILINRVRATFAGTSRPQPGSVRGQILTWIQEQPNNTATVEALEAHFNQPVRGYLQKLIEKSHLVVIQEEE